jgi:hypothetical protein
MVQVAEHPSTLTRASAVGRKRQDEPEPKPKRARARDLGEVTALGVEVETPIYAAAERCRLRKKWSKRTLVEEALKAYLTQEGDWPPPEQPAE